MKVRRFFSVLIGLVLIALIVYKFIEIDMKQDVPIYYATFPSIVNTIIFYTLFGLTLLSILLISIGTRKLLITGLILLPVAIVSRLDWFIINLYRLVIELLGFSAALESMEMFDYLFVGSIAALLVFWLLLLIAVISKGFKRKVMRIILVILALVPLGLYYSNQFFVSPVSYVYEQWETIAAVTSLGLSVFVILMVLLTQRMKKKPQTRSVWFPSIETL